MMELFEHLTDIVGHDEMDLSLFLVPIESDTDVSCSRPIGSDFVVAFECLLEVQSVFFADVFDSKIVHHQREPNWARAILPEAGTSLLCP